MNRKIIILALALCTCSTSDLQRAIDGVKLARELATIAASTACQAESADPDKCDAATTIIGSAGEILEVADALVPEEATDSTGTEESTR